MKSKYTLYVIFVITALCLSLIHFEDKLLSSKEIRKVNVYCRGVLLHTIPSKPDLSIDAKLRDVIPNISNSPLSKCSPTSQIRIVEYRCEDGGNRNHNATWVIETLDTEGNKKTVGGDEFYIQYSYRDETRKKDNRATALPTDNQDGTYTLDFVDQYYPLTHANKTGTGNLIVSFIYTCGIGRMTRPLKDEWKNGGFFKKQYILTNIAVPPIRAIRNLNTYLNGTMKIDLSKFDRVVCFGDSQLQGMCGHQCNPPKCSRPNNIVDPTKGPGNMGEFISSDLLVQAFAILEELHGELLSDNNITSALILNSAAWEMVENKGEFPGHYFNNSRNMYRELVQGIRNRYPNVVIMWKSPQPFHLTVLHENCQVKDKKCRDRVRYMSTSTAEYLYKEQKRTMHELTIPFYDVWEATFTAEEWHMFGDALHYRHWFNTYLLSSLYPEQ